jgi:hypothetical protein
VNARMHPGDTVAVLGDGAVGISAAAAATLFGAAGIVLVGHHDDRLEVGLRAPTPWWRRDLEQRLADGGARRRGSLGARHVGYEVMNSRQEGSIKVALTP